MAPHGSGAASQANSRIAEPFVVADNEPEERSLAVRHAIAQRWKDKTCGFARNGND